jgi:hypothetical protein
MALNAKWPFHTQRKYENPFKKLPFRGLLDYVNMFAKNIVGFDW